MKKCFISLICLIILNFNINAQSNPNLKLIFTIQAKKNYKIRQTILQNDSLYTLALYKSPDQSQSCGISGNTLLIYNLRGKLLKSLDSLDYNLKIQSRVPSRSEDFSINQNYLLLINNRVISIYDKQDNFIRRLVLNSNPQKGIKAYRDYLFFPSLQVIDTNTYLVGMTVYDRREEKTDMVFPFMGVYDFDMNKNKKSMTLHKAQKWIGNRNDISAHSEVPDLSPRVYSALDRKNKKIFIGKEYSHKILVYKDEKLLKTFGEKGKALSSKDSLYLIKDLLVKSDTVKDRAGEIAYVEARAIQVKKHEIPSPAYQQLFFDEINQRLYRVYVIPESFDENKNYKTRADFEELKKIKENRFLQLQIYSKDGKLIKEIPIGRKMEIIGSKKKFLFFKKNIKGNKAEIYKLKIK